MFTASALSGSKPEQYAELAAQARALLSGESDRIANAASSAMASSWRVPRRGQWR